MLAPANLYDTELAYAFKKTWYKNQYMFYNDGCYYEEYEVFTNTCDNHQFASVSYGEVIGYIGYSVDRAANVAFDFNIINFTDDSVVFGADLLQAVDDVFNKFNIDKIEFSVFVGNPAEDMYDEFIRMFGGRVVGTYKKHIKLVDGRVYDMKMYELFKRDYNKRRRKT